MIRVLQSLQEVGNAIGILQLRDCGYHRNPIKNWDLAQIDAILERILKIKGKNIVVLDMGCGGFNVLNLLCRRGLTNCYGIDLSVSLGDRLRQIGLMIKCRKLRLPYKIIKGDLTRIHFPNNSFDLIVCLSVIEHGINIERFLSEAARLLKTEGMLYISTDYWEPKILTNDVAKPHGLAWNIFSKMEIEKMVKLAKECNLRMKNEDVPPINDKVIHWNGKDYTFLSLVFKKV